MTFVPECYSLANSGTKPTIYVVHRPADTKALRDFDWTIFGNDTRIYICAEGYRNIQFNGWNEGEWPHGIRLTREDFAEPHGSVFVCYFASRIKVSLTNAPVYPRLADPVLDELNTLSDYLLTYDATTEQYGIRVREISPEIEHQWIMAKLRRS